MALAGCWLDAFCDRCQVWCKPHIDVARLSVPPRDHVMRELEAGSLEALVALSAPAVGTHEYLRLDLETCPRCNNTHFLTVARIDERSEAPEGESIVSQLVISSADAEKLRSLGAARG